MLSNTGSENLRTSVVFEEFPVLKKSAPISINAQMIRKGRFTPRPSVKSIHLDDLSDSRKKRHKKCQKSDIGVFSDLTNTRLGDIESFVPNKHKNKVQPPNCCPISIVDSKLPFSDRRSAEDEGFVDGVLHPISASDVFDPPIGGDSCTIWKTVPNYQLHDDVHGSSTVDTQANGSREESFSETNSLAFGNPDTSVLWEANRSETLRPHSPQLSAAGDILLSADEDEGTDLLDMISHSLDRFNALVHQEDDLSGNASDHGSCDYRSDVSDTTGSSALTGSADFISSGYGSFKDPSSLSTSSYGGGQIFSNEWNDNFVVDDLSRPLSTLNGDCPVGTSTTVSPKTRPFPYATMDEKLKFPVRCCDMGTTEATEPIRNPCQSSSIKPLFTNSRPVMDRETEGHPCAAHVNRAFPFEDREIGRHLSTGPNPSSNNESILNSLDWLTLNGMRRTWLKPEARNVPVSLKDCATLGMRPSASVGIAPNLLIPPGSNQSTTSSISSCQYPLTSAFDHQTNLLNVPSCLGRPSAMNQQKWETHTDSSLGVTTHLAESCAIHNEQPQHIHRGQVGGAGYHLSSSSSCCTSNASRFLAMLNHREHDKGSQIDLQPSIGRINTAGSPLMFSSNSLKTSSAFLANQVASCVAPHQANCSTMREQVHKRGAANLVKSQRCSDRRSDLSHPRHCRPHSNNINHRGGDNRNVKSTSWSSHHLPLISSSPLSLGMVYCGSSDGCSVNGKRQPPPPTIAKWRRACSFFLRGHCKKEDCEFAHDLTKVTCKFWEMGECFKGSTCPFLHGYPPELTASDDTASATDGTSD